MNKIKYYRTAKKSDVTQFLNNSKHEWLRKKKKRGYEYLIDSNTFQPYFIVDGIRFNLEDLLEAEPNFLGNDDG